MAFGLAHVGRWTERWRTTLILLGTGLLLLDGLIRVITVIMSVSGPEALKGGFNFAVAVFLLGLLGYYPEFVGKTPILSNVGVVVVAVAIISNVLVVIGWIGTSIRPALPPPTEFPLLNIGSPAAVLGFLLFGIASFLTHYRRIYG